MKHTICLSRFLLIGGISSFVLLNFLILFLSYDSGHHLHYADLDPKSLLPFLESGENETIGNSRRHKEELSMLRKEIVALKGAIDELKKAHASREVTENDGSQTTDSTIDDDDAGVTETGNETYILPKEPFPSNYVPPPDLFVREFVRQSGVVIAMKIHASNHISAVKQSLCLFHHAYNKRLLYDIVIFSTLPIEEKLQEEVRKIVAPVKVTFAVDNDGIPALVETLSPEAKQRLLNRCNVSSIEELGFGTICLEHDTAERVSYAWQAEFRSLHIWNQPELASYKYMFWLDSDAFIYKPWDRDPIAYAIRENLALFFANFPQGQAKGSGWNERITRAFNRTVCHIGIHNGHIYAKSGSLTKRARLAQVHGFMHITNLEFFRSEPVMNWFRIMIGEEKFSRRYDDQIGITLPAAVLAPLRSKLIRSQNISLNVFHNSYNFSLTATRTTMHFRKFWELHGETSFPNAYGVCKVTEAL